LKKSDYFLVIVSVVVAAAVFVIVTVSKDICGVSVMVMYCLFSLWNSAYSLEYSMLLG